MEEYYGNDDRKRPFSEAVKTGNTLYVAGQVGINKETGKFPESFTEQAKKTVENFKDVLNRHGYSLSDLVRVQVYLTDVKNAAEFNEIYKSAFPDHFPARTLIGISLVGDALVEIDGIAVKE